MDDLTRKLGPACEAHHRHVCLTCQEKDKVRQEIQSLRSQLEAMTEARDFQIRAKEKTIDKAQGIIDDLRTERKALLLMLESLEKRGRDAIEADLDVDTDSPMGTVFEARSRMRDAMRDMVRCVTLVNALGGGF